MSDKRAILNISERLLFEVSIVRHFIFLKITVKGVDFMNFIISGKNIEVTPGLKDSVINKLGKLERYFTPDTEIIVTLSVEKDRQKIEVTIPVKGDIIRSEQTSTDMYVSIDLVEEVIERQLRKYKNKLIARHQEGGTFKQKNLPSTAMTRFRSCAPRSLVSSQCFRKMLVYRWNFSDTISSYSLMQKQKKLMSCTRERTVHLV